MTKVTVYPRKRWDPTTNTYIPGNTLCTDDYFARHKDQIPLRDQGVQVDSSQLDGDHCIPVSKLPAHS